MSAKPYVAAAAVLMPQSTAEGRALAEACPRPSLLGLSRALLAEQLAAIDVPANQVRMRVAQVWGWLYGRGVTISPP